MNQMQATAESWAKLYGVPGSKEWEAAHDSFLVGWSASKAQAITLLNKQFERCEPRTLVSYAIAADVLALYFKEYEAHESGNAG